MLDQAQHLRNLARQRDEDLNRPKIITVTSGKGGVGKSNFVVNLSITLQKMGKKVLIFDADIGMGNDDVLMGFLPKYNVFDVIIGNKDINDVIITGPYGIKLLPGGSGINRIKEITKKQRKDFISKLEKLNDLDYIIMDTGAGINKTVLGFIACCEELIVITTPEPTSLMDSYSLLKAVNHFNIKKSAKVVINRVINEKEGILTFEKFNNAVKNFLKVEANYLGMIMEDKKLTQAVRMQEPFVISYENSDASKNIKIIAEKLMGMVETKKGLGVRGLFKKMFDIFS